VEVIEIKGDYKEQNEQMDSFLQLNDHLFLHTPHYQQFIAHAFQVCPVILAVVNEKQVIKTILPIVEVKSVLLGNKIISGGYIEYGGFAGD
jgi:hypothetical protein